MRLPTCPKSISTFIKAQLGLPSARGNGPRHPPRGHRLSRILDPGEQGLISFPPHQPETKLLCASRERRHLLCSIRKPAHHPRPHTAHEEMRLETPPGKAEIRASASCQQFALLCCLMTPIKC